MHKLFIVSVMCSTFLLTGCDSVKSKLGLDRHSPDEFSVMQRAPLEIPSDLTKLPVPQPGLPRPQDVTAKQQAAQVVLGNAAGTPLSEMVSSSEKALLSKTNATASSPDIRRQLAEEASQEKSDKRPVIKRLLSIGDGSPSAVVVDAEAEAKRIRDAKAAGKPVTTGETPVIEE